MLTSRSVISFLLAVLLVLQGVIAPVTACEMPPQPMSEIVTTSQTVNSESHAHHMMHGVETDHESERETHSMTMTGDCCGENCQCPKGTGFSNALLGKTLIDDFSPNFQRAQARRFSVLDAHRLSQFKPPIFV